MKNKCVITLHEEDGKVCLHCTLKLRPKGRINPAQQVALEILGLLAQKEREKGIPITATAKIQKLKR